MMVAGVLVLVVALIALLVLWSARAARAATALVPPDGRFIDVPGARLHYIDAGSDTGSGPPIVLVHGLGGHSRNFTYALTERLTPHHRVLIVDRPGSGHSRWTGPTDWRIGTHATIIARFIAALGIDRPLLVGHSLGGAISLAVALDHPEAVRALALIAPLTLPVDTVPDLHKPLMIRSALLRRVIAWTVAIPLAKSQGRRAVEAVFAPEPAPADFETRGGGALTTRPSGIIAVSSELVAVGDDMPHMAQRYAALNLPVGIIYGREDQVLDCAHQGEDAAKLIPGCDLTVIPGGHMIPVTAPDTVADWILSRAR